MVSNATWAIVAAYCVASVLVASAYSVGTIGTHAALGALAGVALSAVVNVGGWWFLVRPAPDGGLDG